MNYVKTLSILTTLVTMLLLAQAVHAERQGQGKRGKPPQVALDACTNVAEGEACAFEGRQGDTLNGICAAVPSGELACVPEGHRERGERGQDRGRSSDNVS